MADEHDDHERAETVDWMELARIAFVARDHGVCTRG
jgi:hypothetical protein